MLDWYLTREDKTQEVFHKGKKILPNQKVLFTPEEVKIHNSFKEVVVLCDAPKDLSECAFEKDFDSSGGQIVEDTQDVPKDKTARISRQPQDVFVD